MATLDSTSSIGEIYAAYLDNVGYEEDGSVAMAKAFVTACRALLKIPRRQMNDQIQIDMDPESIRAEITDARRWVATNDPGAVMGSVKHVSLRGFRD